jgi:outer membrane protein W
MNSFVRPLSALALAAALVAPIANADVAPGSSKGDWIFRAGLSQVNPTASPGLKNPLGNGVDLTADSDVSLTGTIAYMLTDHIGTELLLAWPFEHGIDAKFGGGTKQRVGYAEILPPTLNLQWYFRPDKAFNPYVGVGATWAIFTSSELRKGALGLPQNAKLETSDSFGADVQIGADYYFSKHWLVNGDVRYLGLSTDVDVKNATAAGGTAKLGELDINPMVYTLAVGYRMFQPAPVPVAAPPPPPPPPAAPAKCADTDGDGVCDADDKCPGTPAGDRVGPFGCSCDVTIRTHFAFDSAELTAEDKATLDGVAKRLTELQFVEGTATGHTDSVGDDAYNLKLSERRAQAVVDYLASKGVAAGRIKAIGMGESKPIADNATEAGRAENRRVTIRRTDCGPATN